MEIKRARRIVEQMTGHVFYAQGIKETTPDPLAGLSLAEMLKANGVVKKANDKDMGNGTRTVQIVCDDRLTAALYVLYNYEQNPNRAVVHNSKNFVLVAKLPDDFNENPEYEEAENQNYA